MTSPSPSRVKSPTTGLFGFELARPNNKEQTNASHYRSCVRGSHKWDSTHKRHVIRKISTCHGVAMATSHLRSPLRCYMQWYARPCYNGKQLYYLYKMKHRMPLYRKQWQQEIIFSLVVTRLSQLWFTAYMQLIPLYAGIKVPPFFCIYYGNYLELSACILDITELRITLKAVQISKLSYTSISIYFSLFL